MGKERAIGTAILLTSILVAIGYALLLYFGYGSTLAVILVSVAIYVLLGIVGWIGWTMVTIPSPKSVGAVTQPEEILGAKKTRRGRPRKKA
jgi:hypothetical protein